MQAKTSDVTAKLVEEFLPAQWVQVVTGGAKALIELCKLPFGGTGNSGIGVCHGYDGFLEFSHAKAVFYRAKFNPVAFLDPPYGKMFDRVMKFLLR